MRTLTEIEPRIPISTAPYMITSPGSYYLTGDLVVTGVLNAIQVQTSHVDIDLNGFSIISQGAEPGVDGILQFTSASGLRIRNGHFRGWTRDGYYAIYGLGRDVVVEHVRITDCDSGIFVRTNLVVRNSEIVQCHATGEGYGIHADAALTVDACIIAENSAQGNYIAIEGGTGSHIRNSLIRANTGAVGFRGVSLNSGSIVQSTVVEGNSGDGVVRAFALNESRAVNCMAEGNSSGLDVWGFRLDGSSAVGCSAVRQTGTRNVYGMELLSGSDALQCSVLHTGWGSTNGVGYRLLSSTVRDSTSEGNTSYGIALAGNSVALGNTIRSHLGANRSAIHLFGSRNVADGNTLINNSEGIAFVNPEASGNLVIRTRFFSSPPQAPGDNTFGEMLLITPGYLTNAASLNPHVNLRY